MEFYQKIIEIYQKKKFIGNLCINRKKGMLKLTKKNFFTCTYVFPSLSEMNRGRCFVYSFFLKSTLNFLSIHIYVFWNPKKNTRSIFCYSFPTEKEKHMHRYLYFLIRQLQHTVFPIYTLISRILFFFNDKFQSFSAKIPQTRPL